MRWGWRVTWTFMMGSMMTGAAFMKALRKAYCEASLKAISLLSTEWAAPSVRAMVMPWKTATSLE